MRQQKKSKKKSKKVKSYWSPSNTVPAYYGEQGLTSRTQKLKATTKSFTVGSHHASSNCRWPTLPPDMAMYRPHEITWLQHILRVLRSNTSRVAQIHPSPSPCPTKATFPRLLERRPAYSQKNLPSPEKRGNTQSLSRIPRRRHPGTPRRQDHQIRRRVRELESSTIGATTAELTGGIDRATSEKN